MQFLHGCLPSICLTGNEMKARTHANVESAHFPMRCITRTWKALRLQHRASQALVMHLVGKCAISAEAWFLGIYYPLVNSKYV